MKLTDASRSLFSTVSVLCGGGEINGVEQSANPAKLIDISMGCEAIRPQQIKSEFLELTKLVKEQKCKYILEIGTYRGGTLFVFSQVAASDATVISLDYHFTLLGKAYFGFQKRVFGKFIRDGQSLVVLRKDSHKPETLASIREALHGHPLDFLFIDGDHTYEGVRKDFEMYSPLVRSGGLVAFHDIARSAGVEKVYEFWNEIKGGYSHREFIHKTGHEAMGIGVMWI